MNNNKAIAYVQNQIMLSWKAIMNYEEQLRTIGHDEIIEACIENEKEKVYLYTTILNQLETSVNQAKAILKDAGYYVDNLWHIDDVKGYEDFTENDDEAYSVLDEVLQSERIIEEINSAIQIAIQP
jgi:hypothetical protein